MTGTRLYYVRHGENHANLTGQLSHRVVDHPLTRRGRAQALAAAARLADLRVSGPVVCSPLRRAAGTAAVIAARLRVPVLVDERLREVDVGTLDGRSDTSAWAVYHEVHESWRAGDVDRAFPGGESGRDVVRRLRAALAAAVAGVGPGGTPVVVGHGGILRAALPRLCSNLAAGDLAHDVPNGSLTVLDVYCEPAGVLAVALRTWGEAGHLTGLAD